MNPSGPRYAHIDWSVNAFRKIKRGEVRLNTGKGVLVEVTLCRWDEDSDTDDYFVVEIENPEQRYWLHELSLGPPLNEMEVLAWAAK